MWPGMTVLLFGIVCCFLLIFRYKNLPRYYSGRKVKVQDSSTAFPRHPPKPEWVKKEIVRLKALMPHAGFRTLAHTFNRLYAVKRQMTVGKTYVSYTIQKHQYEIQVLRRKLKHRRPRPCLATAYLGH